jgi:hypothetical protein
MITGNDLTPPASYKALIVGDIDDPQTNYVVVLYAYNMIYIYIIIFIYHKFCASETCKEACKIASEFQVSRRRAAELQIAKKERNYTSKTNLIHSSLCTMVRTWFIGSGRNPYIGHYKAMLIVGITWYNHPQISGYPMFDHGSNMDGEKNGKKHLKQEKILLPSGCLT